MPRSTMHRNTAILAIALLAGCSRCRRGGAAGETEAAAVPGVRTEGAFDRVTIAVGGKMREYLLHVPAGAGASKEAAPIALVVSLHGGGGTAESVDGQTGWRELADKEGFAVAFPSGIGKSWNDGRDDTPSEAIRENADDVGFLVALIEDAAKRAPIDRQRVFMNGISNGAFMTSRFACERADLVAAIGLVAGTIGPEMLAKCKPSRRVSVIAFSGTTDPIVPFEGGTVQVGPAIRGKAASFSESILLWHDADGCVDKPKRSDLPDIDRNDGSAVHLEAFACAKDSAVHAYTVIGGGHTWPGGKQYLPHAVIGNVNRDIDATKAMWSFFVAHPIE